MFSGRPSCECQIVLVKWVAWARPDKGEASTTKRNIASQDMQSNEWIRFRRPVERLVMTRKVGIEIILKPSSLSPKRKRSQHLDVLVRTFAHYNRSFRQITDHWSPSFLSSPGEL